MSRKAQLARAISQLRVRERKLQAELKVCRARIEAVERILRGSPQKYRLSEKGRAAISRGVKKYWREYRREVRDEAR